MQISENGLKIIASFEGMVLHLYDDPAQNCTIGYGRLVHRGPCDGREPVAFRRGISQARAFELLREDARRAEDAVNRYVQVALTQHQFDALVSFVYNVGAGAFRRSTLLRLLNAGDYAAVPDQLRRWTKAGGRVLPGLVRRREAEAQLWKRGAPEEPPAALGTLTLAGGDDNMAVIITAPGTRKNYVTNFIARRFIKTAKERREMVRAGLPPQIREVSEETMASIPELAEP